MLKRQPLLPALAIHTCYLQAAAAARCGDVDSSLNLARNNDVVNVYFRLVAYDLFSQPPPPWPPPLPCLGSFLACVFTPNHSRTLLN